MDDENTPATPGPEFRALVADLKTLKKARRNADEIMRKALEAQREGRMSAADIARLQAARMRAEGGR